MKKSIRFVAVLCAVMLMCGLFAACNPGRAVVLEDLSNPQVSSDDTDWQEITAEEGGTLTMTDGTTEFVLDLTTNHFTVTDTAIGKVYRSAPETQPMASDEVSDRMNSELVVVYYDPNAKPFYMASNPVTRNNEASTVYKYDGSKTIHAYYQLGENVTSSLVPEFFDKETFEQMIAEGCVTNGKFDDTNADETKLGSSSIRRLNRLYEYWDYSELDKNDEDDVKEFNEMIEKYPAVKSSPLYILDANSVTDMQRVQIAEDMQFIGFTYDDYLELQDKYDIHVELELGPGFNVPVEYKLENGNLVTTVLTDKIEENSADYKMQACDLLEYFAAVDSEGEGYYLVPDGCGAMIQMNNPISGSYSQRLYGPDFVSKTEELTQINKNATMPVYGIMEADNTGILAIVEGAAGAATLVANTYGTAYPLNNISLSFEMRTMESTKIEDTLQPTYNLYGKHLLNVFPSVRYIFCGGETVDYVSMAKIYREYLINKGLLTATAESGDAPFYLDITGMFTESTNFLGIPYKASVVLSDIKGVDAVITELNNVGITNTVVRLNGYGKGGLNNYANNRFTLNKGVGTTDQLKDLAKRLTDNGGKLYLDADVSLVFTDGVGDGFTPKDNGSRYLTRTAVMKGDYDRITRKYNQRTLTHWYVSPASYKPYAMAFIDDLCKKLGETAFADIGLSYSGFGTLLGGDNNTKYDLDRSQAQILIEATLKAAAEKNEKIMTDGGNQYTLTAAGTVLNLPLYSSNTNIEVKTIPFYQIVTHGYVDYAGTAFNMSVNNHDALLKSVEYGANLYYSWITNEDSLLAESDYATKLYSLNWKSSFDEAVSRYTALAPYYKAIRNATISGHECVQNNVYRTTYDNGVTVTVNYNKTAVTVDGVEIGARDYAYNLG